MVAPTYVYVRIFQESSQNFPELWAEISTATSRAVVVVAAITSTTSLSRSLFPVVIAALIIIHHYSASMASSF